MSSRFKQALKTKKLWYRAFGVIIAIVLFAVFFVYKQRQSFAQRTHCVGNLVHIELAKSMCQEQLGLVDGDAITENQLDKYLSPKFALRQCPKGGDYIIGNVGVAPQCTYTNKCFTYHLANMGFKLNRRAWTHSIN